MTYDDLMTDNRKLREEVAQLKLDIHQLEVMLRLKHLSQFAPSSERHVATPLFPLDDKSASSSEGHEARAEVKAHLRRKKKRAVIPDHAPRQRVEHDLAESERYCPVHRTNLSRGKDRITTRVEWIPARISVIDHVSATYCCEICDKTVKIAEPPLWRRLLATTWRGEIRSQAGIAGLGGAFGAYGGSYGGPAEVTWNGSGWNPRGGVDDPYEGWR